MGSFLVPELANFILLILTDPSQMYFIVVAIFYMSQWNQRVRREMLELTICT